MSGNMIAAIVFVLTILPACVVYACFITVLWDALTGQQKQVREEKKARPSDGK